jgi:hypothetical protein
MHCGMNRINFDRGDDIEARLLEAEGHPACPGE